MTSSRIVGVLNEPNNLRYFEWKIPNFSYWFSYPYPQNFLISPSFIFENISWHISLRPYDDLSVFLINENQRPLNLNYHIFIKMPKGKLLSFCNHNKTIKNKSGFKHFCNVVRLKSDLNFLQTDTLTIVCMLTPEVKGKKVFQHSAPEVNGKKVLKHSAPKADGKTLNGIVGELTQPNNLRQIEWRIPNFSYWPPDVLKPNTEGFLISPTFIFENTSWHISLFLCEEDASVFLINETQRPCNINFSFSIKDSTGMLIRYRTDDASIKDKSGFTRFFNEEIFYELSSSYTFTIVCILKPGEIGEQASSNAAPKADNYNFKSEVESLKLIKLIETDALSKNLKDLFTNNVSCDTILRVKDRQFCAHRTILMARSSVFAAMFQHDTAEKRTGLVNIPDCDVNTFQEFLEYLYSGKLEGLSFDSAFQLYSTSDKYNVQELKMFCTKCMMQNLSAQNVCDVVILADKYDEAMLYSAAQKFFTGNFKEILKTSEWESLLKMNYRLANKLLIAKSESKE